MAKRVDYIIVGLGIAGACLAMQMLRRNKKIIVFDQPSRNRASVVAAGLFNPITGIRIVKTWKADEIFSYLHDFYSQAESQLGAKFYHPTQLYIPFRSFEEQNEWMSREGDSAVSNYLMKVYSNSAFAQEVRDPLGGILLSNCGYIETTRFINAVRGHLTSMGCYFEQAVDDEKVTCTENNIKYEDISADKIIYCTGVHTNAGTFFRWVPLIPLKGEVLTVKTASPLGRIYNRGVYAVKESDLNYKVGATYELKNIVENVTDEGRQELMGKLQDLLTINFEVSHQDWGIRPSTRDRRPMIGAHPEFKNIYIFNGLGTKGVSLAPYFSGQLAEHLTQGGNLDREANITRVKSLYSKFL